MSFEFCCGAMCRKAFGDTALPFKKAFSVMRLNLDKFNINKFDFSDISKLPHNLQCHCEQALLFDQRFLENGQQPSLDRKN